MIVVQTAKYLEDYRFLVTFSDGLTKMVDLSDALAGPMFEPLRDKTLFSQLSVDPESETVVWPNGADIAPEYLYRQGTPAQTQQNA